MSTNYFLREREPYEVVVTYATDHLIRENIKTVEPHYRRCHLCKLSYGWVPLMCCDPESTIDDVCIRSLRSIEMFVRQNDDYIIVDEYGDQISLDDWSRLVRSWGHDGVGCPDGSDPLSHREIDHSVFVDDEGFEFSSSVFL